MTAEVARRDATGARVRRQALGGLSYILRTVLAEPVRTGRLRDNGWPPGLRGIVVAAGASAVGLLVLTATGPLLRRHTTLVYDAPQQTMPAFAVPIVVTAMILATGTLYAALLHLRPVVRVSGLVIITAAILNLLPLPVLTTEMWPTFAGLALMIIFAIVRWRAGFGWGEYLIALGLAAATIGYTLGVLGDSYGVSMTLNSLNLLIGALVVLAGPFAALAGAALVELTASLAMAVCTAGGRQVTRADRARPGPLAIGLFGLLVAGRALQMIFDARQYPTSYDPAALLLSACVLLIPLAVLAGLYRSGPGSRRVDDSPGSDGSYGSDDSYGRRWFGRIDGSALLEQWHRWALLLAALITGVAHWPVLVTMFIQAVGLPAAWFYRQPVTPGLIISTVASAAVMVLVAVFARRRDGSIPLVLIIFAAMRLIRTGFQLTRESASFSGVFLCADLIAVVLLVLWLVRGTLNRSRLISLAAVLAMTLLYEYRHAVTEPLVELLALSGVIVGLLVGAAWRLLTDNGFAAGDSRHFPRPARVLLVLANAIFGTSMIAVISLQGGHTTSDLASLESLGDLQLGFDLITALLITVIIHALFVDSTGSDADRDTRPDDSGQPAVLGGDPYGLGTGGGTELPHRR